MIWSWGGKPEGWRRDDEFVLFIGHLFRLLVRLCADGIVVFQDGRPSLLFGYARLLSQPLAESGNLCPVGFVALAGFRGRAKGLRAELVAEEYLDRVVMAPENSPPARGRRA